ncbi:hypothetical protein CRM22_004061 [Opisthorchis felineus]|uniref:Ubiquitin carboxyl-terminal hydrolase n=1 Tax=Opisthorchis felineus TaxID=147828 RepID=A0A4S2LYA3_OPIFE|nr:hypothetical protein CRM22_004061 [Opisthorchis felineus]
MSTSLDVYGQRRKEYSGNAPTCLSFVSKGHFSRPIHNESVNFLSNLRSCGERPVYGTRYSRNSYTFHSPSVLRRTNTTSIPISRMTNLPNLTHSESKGLLNLTSKPTIHRDSYPTWSKSKENGLGDMSSKHKPYSPSRQRNIREYSLKPQADGINASSNCSLDFSKYLTTRPVEDQRDLRLKFDRTASSEMASLNLNDNHYNATPPTSPPPVAARTKWSSSGCKGGEGQSSAAGSALSICDKLPSSATHLDHLSSEPCGSTETSNSSNNSSAPRWSNVSLSSPSSTFSAKPIQAGNHCVHPNGGLVGLNNLGNTCFMNSIIQCLSNTHPLLEYCISERYANDLNKSSTMRGNLFTAYASLMNELWDPDMFESSTSPMQFKTQIQRFAPRFVGYSQQDSQEFLRYVLEGLHNEVNRVTKRPHPVTPDYAAEDKLADRDKADLYWKRYLSMDNSAIVDLFVGQLMSTLECAECGFKSTTFDPFWDLSLPIPKKANVNIMDCLRLFTSKEDLDGHERPMCGRCKVRRRCTKHFSLQKFPRILVLHLKRFSGERFRSKMSVLVDYPLNDLNLSEFASPSCQQRYARYNLYAVSNHSGSVYAGHYTAICRHHYRNSWYDYNDSRTQQLPWTIPSTTFVVGKWCTLHPACR